MTENKLKISMQLDFVKNFALSNDDSSKLFNSELSQDGCCHNYSFHLANNGVIEELILSPIWVNLNEHYLTETETCTNIDVHRAHKWNISIKFDEEYSYELGL